MSTIDSDAPAEQGSSMKNGLIAYFAGNPVAGNLLMLFLLAGGVIAGLQLPVQHSPELDLRRIMVTVAAPGSSPKEIEEDINRRIEESLVGLAGVERVVAVAKEGLGRVETELATFADADGDTRRRQDRGERHREFPAGDRGTAGSGTQTCRA